MNKKYFFLNKECILAGDDNPTIYNLLSGDMISIEPIIAQILKLSESGFTLESISESTSLSIDFVEKILEKIHDAKLGGFYDRRIYIEKYMKGDPITRENKVLTPPVISKLLIEIPGKCDLNCSFCGKAKLYQCSICSKPSQESINMNVLKKFLSRIIKMDCRSIVLHGGDPLANLKQFTQVIDFCRTIGFHGKLFVITNGSKIDDSMIELFLQYGVSPIIPILGLIKGKSSENESRLKKLMKIAALFHKEKMKFLLTTVVEKENDIEEVVEFAKSLKPFKILTTVILSDKKEYLPILKKLGNNLMKTTVDVFYHNVKHHPCLDGTIAIAANGDILSCPYLKEEILGNIEAQDAFDKIFEDHIIDKYWNLNLSRVDKCKNCGFRYGCFDCRAIEKELSKNLYGKVFCFQNKLKVGD